MLILDDVLLPQSPSPVSVSITRSSSTLSPFQRPTVTTLKAIQSSWLTSFIPVPGLSWSPNRTPKLLRLPRDFPSSRPLSQVQQLPRWDYILYVHCSFIDNVILADCNRLQLPFPPNLIALQWAAQTVQVCPDFYPYNYVPNIIMFRPNRVINPVKEEWLGLSQFKAAPPFTIFHGIVQQKSSWSHPEVSQSMEMDKWSLCLQKAQASDAQKFK